MNKVIDSSIFNKAVISGNLNKVINLYEQGYNIKDNEYAYVVAARYNHLHILKWLHDNGVKWNKETFNVAVMKGHFEIIEYLRKEGCPYDSEIYVYAVSCSEDRVDILQYLHDNNYSSSTIVVNNNNNIDERVIYQYNIPNNFKLNCTSTCGCKLKFSKSPCNIAAYKGKINSLKWLIEHGFEYDCNIFVAACDGNQLEIIKYLYENQHPWNNDLCAIAAAYGHTKILQYAIENGCIPDERAYISAYFHQQFRIMEILNLYLLIIIVYCLQTIYSKVIKE